MKRSIALLTGLALAACLASVPPAEATAGGLCTISGTINFSPSTDAPSEGRWSIAPAVIDCRGLFNGWERILGPGSFTALGSYQTLQSARGSCLRQLGPGTVDYWIPTSEQDVHLIEPHSFLLAGAGAFTTPSLRGTFQIPLHEGNCLTAPVTKGLFVAQVALVRTRRPPVDAPAHVNATS
ncbi:MAG TPA: hypothetical protein VGR20_07990 [Acidimicrobiia bacterium]|nr:hypothetical protein [Acidimicrobiia bacterium]